MHILSPTLPKTNDAVISDIVNNSSAAFAQIKFASLSSFSYIAIAIELSNISACFTISAISL